MGLGDLRLRAKTFARRQYTESLSATEQDGGSMGLGKKKVEKDTYKGGKLPVELVPCKLIDGIEDFLTHPQSLPK